MSKDNSQNNQKAGHSIFERLIARLCSVEVNFGVGFGLHGSVKAGEVEVSGGARATELSLKINKNGFDLGNEFINGGGIGPVGFYDGYYHSWFCPLYNEIGQHDGENCPYSKKYQRGDPSYNIGVGIDVYVILGLNASIEWSEDIYYEILGE